MNDLAVVLQAGGKSTRMGQDKGLAPLLGRPLVRHILDQVTGIGQETIIITNQPDAYRQFGVPLFGDVYPGIGALGGLYSALHHASQPYCLVLACDMPFVNRPLLQHLISLAPDHDAVIPLLKPVDPSLPAEAPTGQARRAAQQFAEPFRAIYNKSCLEPIRAAIEAGQRRVISFFDQVNIRFVERAEIERFDPDTLSFFNINTSEDLAEAERLAQEWDADWASV